MTRKYNKRKAKILDELTTKKEETIKTGNEIINENFQTEETDKTVEKKSVIVSEPELIDSSIKKHIRDWEFECQRLINTIAISKYGVKEIEKKIDLAIEIQVKLKQYLSLLSE